MFARPGSFLRRAVSSGVFWAGLVTGLRGVGFLLVLPWILRRLSPDQVGLWYVYSGVAGICMMVEMGFAPVISRFTTYYAAGLRGLPGLEGFVPARQGEAANQAGLAGLIRMARRLYAAFAVAVFLAMLLGGGGWLLWKYRAAFLQPRNFAAFLLFSLGTAWSMRGFYWTGMLFGIDRVRDYQKTMLGGLLLNYAVILIGLWLRLDILALVLGQVALALAQRGWARRLFQRHRPTTPAAEGAEPLPIRWRHLWPMTWRGGLMGLGMYLSFGILTLVCAQLFDLETTARYALSFQLVIMASTLGNAWLVAKYPVISTLYVAGRRDEIRRLVARRAALQMLFYVGLCALAWRFAPPLLHALGARTNFLDPWPLFLLMAAGAVDLHVGSIAAVVQSGNQFPFVRSKLANGALTLLFAVALGKEAGLNGMICAPAIAQLLYNGWYVILWCRRDLERLEQPNAPAA